MGGTRNLVRPLAAQDWEKTIYWSRMEVELEEAPREFPDWAKMILMGIAGGSFFGILLGLGLAGVI